MVKPAIIQEHIVSMLDAGLSKALTYHNTAHTLDVTFQCMLIAKEEGITDKQQLYELEIAALYHDTGFLYIYNGHEEIGCKIANEQLPGFGIDRQSIDRICSLIMATKVPQAPLTHLQKIICDADLDYLGRDDFFEISDNLRRELIAYKFIESDRDWEERQLSFLQSHEYFTNTCRHKRTREKNKVIQHLNENRITK